MKSKLSRKVILFLFPTIIVSFLLLLFITVVLINDNNQKDLSNLTESEINNAKEKLKSYIDIVESRFDYYIKMIDDKNSKDNVINSFILEMKTLRYSDNVGYFWINNMEDPYPRMIMHPTKPDLDGTILDSKSFDVADGNIKNLFVAFVDICKNNKDGGYLKYLWPKPTKDGLTENLPKISMVKQLTGTDFIIGTGFYIDDIAKKVAIATDKKNSDLKSLLSILSAVFLSCMVMSLVFIQVLTKIITKPISKIMLSIKEINDGKGDLTKTINVDNKDEIGDLSKEMNEHLDFLRTQMLTFAALTIKISGISEYIRKVSMDINNSSKTGELRIDEVDVIVKRFNELSAAINKDISSQYSFISELSGYLSSVSDGFKEIETNISKVNAGAYKNLLASESGIEKMKNSMAKSVSLAEFMHNIEKEIKKILSISDEITGIASTIQDIANESNVLAINAAIESAHAGVAGKGFAIVSNKMRDISNSINLLAQQIEKLLKENREDTASALSITEDGISRAKDLLKDVKDVDRDLQEIIDTSKETNHMAKLITQEIGTQSSIIEQVNEKAGELVVITENINMRIDDQIKGSSEISEKTAELFSISKNNLLLSEELEHNSSDLHAEKVKLEELVSKFKT